ncbi:MAG TPA: DUF1993 domain-containing protein [Polyangiales bacterium]|nr:DUF1993 domain-containing protein [Polyangiales bacterium]
MSEFHAQLVQMTKMLKNLDGWLEKSAAHAKAKSFDPAVLLQARLAPDMFPLVRQIQSACDGVKFLASRASGKDAPKHADSEQATLEELRARIAAVVQFAEGFSAKDFEGADKRVVPIGFMPGKGMLARDFMNEMNVSNTYFHLSMAYAILRHNGVEVTKTDYIGSLNLRDL